TGTSFAAPIVAGACALLFECRGGTGGAADILQDLALAAGPGLPPTDFGAGYLQMDTVCSPFPAIPLLRGNLVRATVGELFDPPPPPDPTWWMSPDIRIAVGESKFADNPLPRAAREDGYRVLVTVRNSSRKELQDVTVQLFWARLGTGLVSV